MPKIRVLPDILASQVAAGEVVERPASVVKELVENSIDAGASEIRVDIDCGGSGMIRVSDDGCGMSQEDALLSLERHATSKLQSASGLASILTLGFRGEAIPSIASVSRFRIVTREKDALAGTEILIEGGTIRDVREAGCAPGTTIEAKALFFNMPARRKFLRAETTESAHVEHQLRLHALAAPKIRFRLRRDGRDIFDFPGVENKVDRVRQLLGNDLAGELIFVPHTRGQGISVVGFLLPPSHARKGRRHQFVFLNGRPVEDGIISRALAEGFRGGLASGLYPAAWIWIEMDPLLVDVNVHPAKREVRFHRPSDIRETTIAAVGSALSNNNGGRTTLSVPAIAFPTMPVAFGTSPFQAQPPVLEGWCETSRHSSPQTVETAVANAAPRFRLLGMLQQRFAVMESDDGLVLFDPKIAWERIYFETLQNHQSQALELQPLLVPILLELDPRDFEVVVRQRSLLADAGMDLEPFGGNTVQVRSMPACLQVEEPRLFLTVLLDEFLNHSAPGAKFTHERLFRLMAKRASIQIRPKLEDITAILTRLFRCDLPYCGADGRPTLTEFSIRELDRRFGGG